MYLRKLKFGIGAVALIAVAWTGTAQGQVASSLINEDAALDVLGTGTQVNGIDYPRINDNGGWAIRMSTNNGPSNPDIIYGTPDSGTAAGVIRQEGTVAGLLQTSFNGTGIGLDNAGQVFYRAVISGGQPTLYIDDTIFVEEETPIVGGPFDGFTWDFLTEQFFTRDGLPWYVVEIRDGGGTETEHIFRGNYEVLLSGGQMVEGFPAELDNDTSVFSTLFVSRSGTNYIVVAEIETTGTGIGSTENTGIVLNGKGLTVNGTLLQEGHAVPNGLPGENFSTSTLADFVIVNDFGDWVLNTATSAASTQNEILMINGQVVGREGDLIGGGPDVYGGTIDAFSMNNQGDWVAFWTINGTTVDAVIFNGQIMLIEGEQVDFDGNGDPNDDTGVLAATVGVFDEGLRLTDRDANGDVDIYMILDVNPGAGNLEGVYKMTVNAGAPSAQELEIKVTPSPSPLTDVPGQIAYTVYVRNNSPTSSTGVSVTSTLDAGQTFNAGLSDPIAMDVAGDVVANIGALGPYEIAQYTFVVDVANAGLKTVTSTLTANEADPNNGNNVAVTPVQVGKSTDVTVSIADSPDPLFALGGQITYTVSVTNNGPSDADDVDVLMNLDPQSTFVGGDPVVIHNAGQVTADINGINGLNGTLASGATFDFQVIVQVNVQTTISADASVTSADSDPDLGNNFDVETTTVVLESDLEIEISDNTLVIAPGDPLTYTVTVTNNGPSDVTGVIADVMLASGATLVSVDPPGAPNGANVQANIGNMSNGAVVAFNILVDTSNDRYLKTRATVVGSGVETDPSIGNNTADAVTHVFSSTAGTPQVIMSTINGHPTAQVPGLPREFDSFQQPHQSPNGQNWILIANMDGATADDDIIVRSINGIIDIPAQEGVTLDDLGTPHGAYDEALTINNAGNFAFATNFGTLGDLETEIIVKNVGGVFTTVARGGDINPVVIQFYNFDLRSPLMQEDNTVWFYALLGDSVGAITGRGFFANDGNQVLVRADIHAPQNQLGGGNLAWNDFDRYEFSSNSAGTSYLIQGRLTSPFDDVVATGNPALPGATATTRVVQTGEVLPGLASPVDAVSGSSDHTVNHMVPNGDWYALGDNDDNSDWVVRNGSVLAATGQEIFPGAGENYDDAAFSSGFFMATGNSDGDFVIGSVTDCQDGSSNAMLVLNNERILAREGDPIDVDGNGMFDDDAYISSFGNWDIFLTDSGDVYFNATLRNGSGSSIGEAFMTFSLEVSCATLGDVNVSGTADGLDIHGFVQCVLSGGLPAGCECADMDNSGDVTLADIPLFAATLVN